MLYLIKMNFHLQQIWFVLFLSLFSFANSNNHEDDVDDDGGGGEDDEKPEEEKEVTNERPCATW